MTSTRQELPVLKDATAPATLDMPIDYQKLRHTHAARWLRGLLYKTLVGPKGWPMVFRAPAPDAGMPVGTSPHLYVHLPFCKQICPHCPYVKTRYEAKLHKTYGEALMRELDAYLAQPKRAQATSLYFGGGTPTETMDLIEASIEKLRPLLTLDAEIGVEVHPQNATLELLQQLRALGVTRISLGIETFRPDLLKKLARAYTPEQAEQAIRDAKAMGFECVDVNLIFSIPGQREEETAEDARRCLALGVDQLSAYQLFTFVHTPIGKRVAHGDFQVYGDRPRLRAQKRFNDTCLAAGLVRTSPWNFSKPGVAPYSTVTHEDYVGFGAGAGSKVGGVFWFNTFSVSEYAAQPHPRPALVLETARRFERAHALYWQLYRMHVTATDSAREFPLLFWALRLTGMLRREGSSWRVTELGSVWMHRVQQLFSISYIDDLWDACQREPWPEKVVLA